MSENTKDQASAIEVGARDFRTRLDAIARVRRDPQARLSERALAALVECLGAQPKAVQRGAVDALAAVARYDERVVPALRAALEGDEPRRRWAAAYTLGLIGGALDLRAQKALLEALSNPDGDVRWAAAELIVRLGRENPSEVRRGLMELESHAADYHARKMAIYCLRDLRFRDPEVRAMVERASRSAEAGVRLAVLSLLGHLSDADAEGAEIAIRCLASDPEPGVRRAAAGALSRLGCRSPNALEALERASSQRDDPALSKAARQALGKLGRV